MSTHLHLPAALALSMCLGGLASAQNPAIQVQEPGRRKAPQVQGQTLHEQINDVIGLTGSSLADLQLDTTPGVTHSFQVPIDGVLQTVVVSPHSARDPELYQVLVQVEGGDIVEWPASPMRTVRGFIENEPGSRVVGSLLDSGAHVVIQFGIDDDRYTVEPVGHYIDGVDPSMHVIYHDSQVLPKGECGLITEISDQPAEPVNTGGAGGGVAGAMGGCFWFAELACDADFPYFQDYGTISGVESRINLIINIVNQQYEDDVDIHHEITTILIRTSLAADPYPDTNPIDAGTLLNAFDQVWSTAPEVSIQRDLAQLFSGRNFAGSTIGIAALAQVCNIFGAFMTVENINGLTCQTDLSAHEMGHSWAANHCSCGNPSYTMNSSLTCANRFHPTNTAPEIINFRESRSCLTNACIPLNNTCDGAFLVTDGSLSFDTFNTSTEGPSDSLCTFDGDAQVGSDIWFQYVAECDGIVDVDICSSNYDTKLAVYDLFCPDFADTALACSDDDCGGDKSQLSFSGIAGATYFIRVGGFLEAQGGGFLNISGPLCLPPPANDDCGSATFTTAEVNPVNSFGATTDGPEEAACGGPIQMDVWFRFFNATSDTTLTFSICDATFDTTLAVYGASCPGGPDTALGCSDDDCGDGSSVTIDASLNSFYRVRIGSANGAVGVGNLMIESNPINDCNENGTPDEDDISGGTSPDCNTNGVPDECDITAGTSTDLNSNGTPDDCEPDCDGNMIPDDVDIADGTAEDCNNNNTPDSCDIDSGLSSDDNGNGVPDECDPADCPTDTDGNGATDVDDLVAIILDWGTDGSANNTDVNNSGSVDVDDLVAVILAWGPCDVK